MQSPSPPMGSFHVARLLSDTPMSQGEGKEKLHGKGRETQGQKGRPYPTQGGPVDSHPA